MLITSHRYRASRVIACGALLSVLTGGLVACSQQDLKVSADLRATLLNLGQAPPELNVAEAAAQAECLRAHGWDAPVDLRVPSQTGLTNLAGITGVFASVDQANVQGYDSSVASIDQSTPLEQYIATLDQKDAAQIDHDIFGDSSKMQTVTLPDGGSISMSKTGCLAEARTRIYGTVADYLQYVSFRNEIARHVHVDADTPGVVALMDDYSRCMSESGIEVANVYETQQMAAERFGESRPPGSVPSVDESALAKTDATCQERARLLDTLNEIFFTQAARWISDNESWILGILEIKERSLKNAKNILEGVGGQG